ncbi:hypothetical protein CPB84DRAFT_1826314 [Gymnopilus junonius]|uniref:Uncharacterized protein n=1 Tax=Gymnopilus junonius TaxID=109634 RepID=A0A9P5NJU7_GYMJU|nr:hypothetical protein CPB84DRAFT_1826314 [Gymnopilus junonius]
MPDSNKIMSVARLAFKDYLSPDQIIELGAPEKMIDGGIRWVNIFDWDYIMLPGSEAGVFLKGSKVHEFPYAPAPTTSRHLAQPCLGKTKVVTVKDWNANPDLTVMWAFSLSTLEDDVRAFFDPTDNDSLTNRLDVERLIAGQKVWVRIPNWLALYGLSSTEITIFTYAQPCAAERNGIKVAD